MADKGISGKSTGLLNKPFIELNSAGTITGKEETTEEDEFIKVHEAYLRKDVRCSFCSGWGHNTKQCTTLKQINKHFASSPGLRASWGKHKSKIVHERVMELVNKGKAARRNPKK